MLRGSRIVSAQGVPTIVVPTVSGPSAQLGAAPATGGSNSSTTSESAAVSGSRAWAIHPATHAVEEVVAEAGSGWRSCSKSRILINLDKNAEDRRPSTPPVRAADRRAVAAEEAADADSPGRG